MTAETLGVSAPVRPARPPGADTAGWGLAWRLARRELRGGLAGFRILIACLFLGVASIAGVGSVAAALQAGLRADARILLGGELELRSTQAPIAPGVRAWLAAHGTVSQSVEMRSMVRRTDNGARSLTELKAVDGTYPLYGALEADPAQTMTAALEPRDGIYGALVDPAILARLGLKVGDPLALGSGTVAIRGIIRREPDSGTNPFVLGPRVMVALPALDAAGLLQPGTLATYVYKVRLPPGSDVTAFQAQLEAAFPDGGWRLRTYENAAPSLQTFIDRTALYLTLVGLAALLLGGVGVSNAATTYLAGKTRTIATLKSLGAPGPLIFRLYLLQVMVLAAIGIVLGLVAGAAAPFAVASLAADALPVALRPGPYAAPLLVAALYGFLVTLLFAVWPLARARDVPPTALFRGSLAGAGRPRPVYLTIMGAAGLGLATLAVATAAQRNVALWFLLAVVLGILVFRAAAMTVARLARAAGGVRAPSLRLALANLHRPGALTGTITLSLGLGLTVMVMIALLQANLERQLTDRIPPDAPAYFFLDIQTDQLQPLGARLSQIPGVSGFESVPSLRGRISRIKDVPVEKAHVAPGAQWVAHSDRGFTYLATLPRGSTVVDGQWWPADYKGSPLVSIDANLAHDMGVTVGDSLTLNILGRDITARIANLRRIDWNTLGINFFLIFAPGTLEGAPQTNLATVQATPAAEQALERAVGSQFPNITLVNVREALATVGRLLGAMGTVLRITAAVTLVAGVLVLVGAIASGQRRRRYDAVVLKVLGATRGMIGRVFLLEYGLLGLLTALLAAGLGTLAAWLILTRVMNAEFRFMAAAVAPVLIGAVTLTLVLGFAGTWRALGVKPARLLRDE